MTIATDLTRLPRKLEAHVTTQFDFYHGINGNRRRIIYSEKSWSLPSQLPDITRSRLYVYLPTWRASSNINVADICTYHYPRQVGVVRNFERTSNQTMGTAASPGCNTLQYSFACAHIFKSYGLWFSKISTMKMVYKKYWLTLPYGLFIAKLSKQKRQRERE